MSSADNTESNEVEDAGDCNVEAGVTTSSPEGPDISDFLPFQSLSVELEEGVGSSDNTITNEDSCKASTAIESSNDTVLSTNGVLTSREADAEDVPMEPNSVENSMDPTEHSLLNELADESTIDASGEVDSAVVDYDQDLKFNEDMSNGSQNHLNASAKSYLTDFLFSSASSSFVIDSDSASNDEKGFPLQRFPKIVKGVENADYGVLQTLYRLLYLRNAWDTEKILTQSILDFSGFNCDVASEDYYTREVMLRTMPFEMLRKIGLLLAVPSRSPSSDMEKVKLELVSSVMSFLHKPKRPPRKRSRPGSAKKQAAVQQKTGVTSSPVKRKKSKPAAATAAGKKLDQASSKNSVNVAPEPNPTVDIESLLASPVKSDISHVKPGPLSVKLKAAGYSDEKILEIERELKAKVQSGNAAEPKVDLERLDLNLFDKLMSGRLKLQVETKKDEDSIDSGDTVVDREVIERAGKKLGDFPVVVSSIEGTPDELLIDVHNLLFLCKGEVNELKENILNFSGFMCKEEDGIYRKRAECLNKMEESVVKNIARALYLDPKSDKSATIAHLLLFLNEPDDKLLRPTVIAPGMLSDCDIDIEGMSDSDDSITCEIVHKKVECIDLLSSGEESDGDNKKSDSQVIVKKEPDEEKAKAKPTEEIPVASETAPLQTEPVAVVADGPPKKRSLKDFETITKIVNTHPTEYLVDIYQLLFMSSYEISTIRKDILDFGGFEFEKATPEYVKRKQFLDRMLYNSVRRIYNTLIHNTREVKVFSKPTMIGEIFQFLFKLPDHDTSIRPPPPKPVASITMAMLNKDNSQQNAGSAKGVMPVTTSSQSGKLSDLKRVFQRVACFPCEYLVDVHKLLFMTDCEMKDIRANIFGFKGFAFGIDSSEFNQRKMYLEYLTFHSLRKISSVLTTKTVDLRNSTKHELANHLTEVLKEYTNTFTEIESVPAPIVTAAQSASSVTAPVVPTDQAVEEIVVTPIIDPSHASPVPSPGSAVPSTKDDSMTVSSSTPVVPCSQPVVSSTATPKESKKKEKKFFKTRKRNAEEEKDVSISAADSGSNQQFADINLPELEKYRMLYDGNQPLKILPKPDVPSVESFLGEPNDACHLPPKGDIQSNSPFGYRPEYLLQQPFAPIMQPPVQLPLMHPFPQQLHLQNPAFVLPQRPPMRPRMGIIGQDEHGKPGANFMAENLLNESSNPSPATKRRKKSAARSSTNANSKSGAETLRIIDSSSLAEKKDDTSNPSSLHMKIRDAMTKASEDEEDCDKPLATLVGHPNDKVLKQQICEIVENTDLQEITINGVIQKIFSMYPKFNLNYRKEFIKSTLRSLLYRLGEQENSKGDQSGGAGLNSPDCSVSTTDPCDSPELSKTSEDSPRGAQKYQSSTSFQQKRNS